MPQVIVIIECPKIVYFYSFQTSRLINLTQLYILGGSTFFWLFLGQERILQEKKHQKNIEIRKNIKDVFFELFFVVVFCCCFLLFFFEKTKKMKKHLKKRFFSFLCLGREWFFEKTKQKTLTPPHIPMLLFYNYRNNAFFCWELLVMTLLPLMITIDHEFAHKITHLGNPLKGPGGSPIKSLTRGTPWRGRGRVHPLKLRKIISR